jgi:anti-anti-sigma factor
MPTNEPAIFSMEYFGEIAILRIETTRLYDEYTVRSLDAAIEACGERSQIVFDMVRVFLISSLALSRLMKIQRQSKSIGRQIVLCNMTPKVSEAFRTSNLDRLFKITSSLEEALAALSWSLEIGCPIAGCEGNSLSHERSIADREGELCCRFCGCRFWVAPFQLAANGEAQAAVSRFAIPTYEQEQIRAELGVIVDLRIVGRLDLFASEALVDAMRSLPQASRALLDLRSATELSEPGLRLLEEHVHALNLTDRVVALVDSDRFDQTRAVLSHFRISMNRDEAMAVLRAFRVSDESQAPLLVSARTVNISAEKPQSREAGSQAGGHEPSSRISAGRRIMNFVQSLFT